MSITPSRTPAPNAPANPVSPLPMAGRPETYGGYGYGGYSNPTSPYGTSTLGSGTQQIDLLGAVLRRKFIVILLGMVGCGLGYVHFTKTPPRYMSALNLQITQQAPPSLVEGDSLIQRVSAGKWQNLLVSQIVLKEAVERFLELRKLENRQSESSLIEDLNSGVAKLKKALKVKSVDKNSEETLALSLQGADAAELPELLNFVVEAFSEVLAGDNKAVGEESMVLIEKLLNQTMREKEEAESRYLELLKTAGVDPAATSKEVSNPHAERLNLLVAEEKTLSEELRRVKEKLVMGRQARDSQDPIQLRVLAIEAKQYLKVDYENRYGDNAEFRQNEQLANDIRFYDKRLQELNDRVTDLVFARQEMALTHGSGHKKIMALEGQIEYFRNEHARVLAERDNLAKAYEEGKSADTAQKVDWDQVRLQTEQQWIALYLTALEREEIRLSSNLAELVQEVRSTRELASKVAGDVVELTLLQKSIEEKREAARVTLDRLSEINVLSSSYNQTKVRVIDPPSEGLQVDPSLPKSLGIGLFLGCLLGAGLALLIDRNDHVFRSPHEISQILGTTVLGRIPRTMLGTGEKGKATPQLISAHRTNSSFAEAFRAARTALFFAGNSEGVRTIVCTSPSPGDGKSTSICNLALSMAQAGKRVLLIDADLRRPRVDRYFGLESRPGILDYLNDKCSLPEAIRQSPQEENLYLLTAGGRPKNPGEIVASDEFLNLINDVRDKFDFVLIDSPPILPVADPVTIAAQCDAVLMVVRIRKGVKVTSQKAKESLDRVGARIVGVLVNGVDENPFYNEYGYYSYSYGAGHGRYGTKYYDKGFADYHDKIETKE